MLATSEARVLATPKYNFIKSSNLCEQFFVMNMLKLLSKKDYLENIAPQFFEKTKEIKAHLEIHTAQPMRNCILPERHSKVERRKCRLCNHGSDNDMDMSCKHGSDFF